MNCRNADYQMQRALDAPLTAPERARLDAHLSACPACRRAWEEYRWLSRDASAWAARPASSETPAAEFTARVLARLESRPVPVPVWPRLLPAVASAVLLLALSPLIPLRLPPVPHFGTVWASPGLWASAQGVFAARWAEALLAPALVINTLFVLRARRRTA